MKDYYIYIHFRKDNLQPFYVGKGKGRRVFSKQGRSEYWKRIVNKYGYFPQIMENNLTEEKAFEREKFYIQVLGRDNLCNMTDGGDGTSGNKLSAETKRKIGENTSKKLKGKKLPESTKKKLSLNSPKCKKVINTLTGEIYNNPKEIADKYNINLNTLYAYLLGLRKNKTPYTYLHMEH